MKKYLLLLVLLAPFVSSAKVICPEGCALSGEDKTICYSQRTAKAWTFSYDKEHDVMTFYNPNPPDIDCSHVTIVDEPTSSPDSNVIMVPPSSSDDILPSVVPSSTPNLVQYKFTKALRLGMRNAEVKELQTKLKEAKLFKGAVNGYFNSQTKLAVRAYQKKNGLAVTGVLDTKTRSSLNK